MGRIIITGIGRAGTTVLTELLTELGEDTGFTKADGGYRLLDQYRDRPGFRVKEYDAQNRCGYEIYLNLGRPRDALQEAPRVIKDPMLYEYIPAVVRLYDVDVVLVPVRDLTEAARSRVKIGVGPGGLWEVPPGASVEDQRAVLERVLSRVVVDCAKHRLPLALLHFPTFVKDPDYCFGVLAPYLLAPDRERFDRAFHDVVDHRGT